ncbi:MAG: DUF881 domain-containing protein, partial [Nocardioidaceae bacterium]
PGPESQRERAYAGLLTKVMTETLDRDYVEVAARRQAGQQDAAGSSGDKPATYTWRAALVAVALVFGSMLGLSALETDQDKPAIEAERAELIKQIELRQDRLDDLQGRLGDLSSDIVTAQDRLALEAVDGSQLGSRLTTLGVAAGTVAVTGPGVTVTIDDGYAVGGLGDTIVDKDLQVLTNALWQAGAEAIAIDGHRLTSLTAIRSAGEAITVDYRSLTPPYVIEATGNPDTLPARLLETQAGQLWLDLEANFGIRFDVAPQEKVEVSADPHDHLLYATGQGETR